MIDAIIIVILAIILFFVVRSLIKDKKSHASGGCAGCGGGCSACAMAGQCHGHTAQNAGSESEKGSSA